MNRPRRWAAAAGVGLALLATTGPATAQTRAAALNTTPQVVGAGSAQVVIKAGTSPATAASPAWTAPLGLVQYGVLTNVGSLRPASVTIVASGVNVTSVQACSVPWDGSGNCPGTTASLTVNAPLPNAQLPAPQSTWYLKMSGVALGVTFYATCTAPTSTAVNNS